MAGPIPLPSLVVLERAVALVFFEGLFATYCAWALTLYVVWVLLSVCWLVYLVRRSAENPCYSSFADLQLSLISLPWTWLRTLVVFFAILFLWLPSTDGIESLCSPSGLYLHLGQQESALFNLLIQGWMKFSMIHLHSLVHSQSPIPLNWLRPDGGLFRAAFTFLQIFIPFWFFHISSRADWHVYANVRSYFEASIRSQQPMQYRIEYVWAGNQCFENEAIIWVCSSHPNYDDTIVR